MPHQLGGLHRRSDRSESSAVADQTDDRVEQTVFVRRRHRSRHPVRGRTLRPRRSRSHRQRDRRRVDRQPDRKRDLQRIVVHGDRRQTESWRHGDRMERRLPDGSVRMAPGTSHLGWLVAAAICVALVVTGCGGGSSSTAPATAGSTDAQTAENSQSANEGAGGANEKAGGETEDGGKQAEKSGGGNAEKKTPPVEAPEGPSEKGPSKEQEENAPLANMVVKIPN